MDSLLSLHKIHYQNKARSYIGLSLLLRSFVKPYKGGTKLDFDTFGIGTDDWSTPIISSTRIDDAHDG